MVSRRIFIGGLLALSGRPAAASDLLTFDYGPSQLDIHEPQPGKRLPVLLYIRGGAWQVGSRKDVRAKPRFFRSLGFLFVSADHRDGPFHKPDRQAADVAAAYRWVRDHIAAHGGDPARIIVMGHSSGSHLAALAALKGDMPGVAGLILNDIQMYDIARYAALRGGLPRHFAYLFAERKWAELSPVTYIGRAKVPPVLIAFSQMRLSRELSLEFASRLKAAGAQVSIFDGSAYSHLEIDRRIGAEQGGMTAAVAGFVNRYS